MPRLFRLIHVAIIASLLFLLCSCSHVARKDGPPNFYVDETKIHNAVPKREPLAKYGNKPYRVFGKRYAVMHSSKNYNQIGIASWYGTKFHKRHTSSGEPYNMLAMTAAHKSLPLPTYVEVTNLQNRRKVIVKVNDRGPFAPKRIIDLSYVAAKKLGMIGHGTTLVRVKAIDPYHFRKHPLLFASRRSAPIEAPAPNWQKQRSGSLYLQVGAFRNKENADRLRLRLLTFLNAPVNIIKPMQPSQLYRVKVGPIYDVETANRLTRRLQNMGIQPNRMYGV